MSSARSPLPCRRLRYDAKRLLLHGEWDLARENVRSFRGAIVCRREGHAPLMAWSQFVETYRDRTVTIWICSRCGGQEEDAMTQDEQSVLTVYESSGGRAAQPAAWAERTPTWKKNSRD
jgi:hypothetical protein